MRPLDTLIAFGVVVVVAFLTCDLRGRRRSWRDRAGEIGVGVLLAAVLLVLGMSGVLGHHG